jgi:hypothetical protein
MSDLEAALEELERVYCGCNVMRGYTCGIHARVNAIRMALVVLAKGAQGPNVRKRNDK